MKHRDETTRIAGRRRMLLLAGMAVCAAGWSPATRAVCPDAATGGAIVPPYMVSLAAYGGVPGAEPSILKNAFAKAFASLQEKGGGTLLVPPGVYDFGRYAESVLIVRADNLRNIAISAYGASFVATTTAKAMPFMFYFLNPENVTIAGARFFDPGFDPSVNWKGMYCAGIQADRESRGFRMCDCRAESVIGLFSANNNAGTRHYLEDIDIQGEIRNAYYGVGASFIRERVRVNLICHNVRRAFIAYALKDADITVVASSTADWLGSNGLVSLVAVGGPFGNVENVRVRVDATGAGIYGGYVHFYHQGPEAEGYMRDIDATVNLSHVSGTPRLFVFDHETNGVQAKTSRAWNNIRLHGQVAGKFDGRIISNPSVSTSPGAVYADANLAKFQDMSKLPAYFSVRSP